MSDEISALQQARNKVDELLSAAKSGAIIPIRLPAQIEEIGQLLEKAETEAAEKATSPDMKAYLESEAYFVSHAVHELRTPMTSIRGYSDMLGAMGPLNDMQKQFLDVIKTNTKRMEGLLADVSYVNKIRKGTLKLTDKMDMFKNVAMKVEKELEATIAELGRAFELDIVQGLPILNLDSDMLVLALKKLVENALRYSPKETGKVILRGRADNGFLVITVEDNGIGMSAEDIAKLGTIYFRSERDEVREYKGSGLGIPIAYGLIELLGGKVTVESEVNVGTKFIIRLAGMS